MAPTPGWRLAAEGALGLLTLGLLAWGLRTWRRRGRVEPATVTDAPAPDPLTGLLSRPGWIALAERRLAQAGPSGQPVALLLIDLDRLGGLNETHGQRAGDRALQAVAERLREALGATDLAGRLGGTRFAVLRIGADADAAPDWARSFGNTLAREPLALADGRVLALTVSIGVSVSSGSQADAAGQDALERLLRQAAVAVQEAQTEGGDAVRRHDPAQADPAGSRRQTARELAQALGADELRLDYQAVYDAGGQTPVAAEALLRWQHPQRGLVPPAQFIDIAEDTGLIVPIGAWVLRRACADAVRWPRPLPVAVNLSVRQLQSRDLVDQVRAALAESGLPASRLELELTESALANSPQVARTLEALRELGVALSLDDFGTGFSSLAYLQRYRFDRLKIDRAFVQPLQDGAAAPLALVRALVDLARALGMRCTAEGIEHAHQLDLLRALGCDAMQGFHLARPCGAAELLGRLAPSADVSAQASAA